MAWSNYSGTPERYSTGPAEAVSQVKETMQRMQGLVSEYTARVDRTLDALQGVELQGVGPAPDVTIARNDAPLDWTNAPLDGLAIDDMEIEGLDKPAHPNFRPLDTNLDIGAFDPGVTITLPAAPVSDLTASAPVRPDIDTSVSLPGKPVLIQPVLDAMDEIQVPTFTFPTLPLFTDAAPEFTEAAPNVVINWAEPTYASENFDLMLATVARMMNGRTGLPDDIEAQLFDKARAREDMTVKKAVAEAFDTFATRGFSMPPGMLVEQTNAAREAGQLQTNTLNRDLFIKVADVAIENMRNAVQQGLAAENILYSIFNNAQTRAFEIAKYTVESQMALYNAQVSLFNARTTSYQTRASVYKIELEGKLAELDMYRVQLEGQKIVSDINQQRVQTFLAKIQALTSQVEIYKAEMGGAEVKARVIQSQIEGYKADVSAYAETLNAEKVRFDVYRTQVEGEVAKVGIIDAQARVFASMAGVEQAKADIRMKSGQLEIEQTQALTQRFASEVDHARAVISAKVAKGEAQARVLGLSIQNLSAQSDANRAKSEAAIRVGEQQLQSNLAAVQNQIKLYEASMQRTIEEARIKIAAMQAAGTMASTLAGGAMAAQHVQASISAGSNDSTSFSVTKGESATENWQYTPLTTK